MVKILVLEVKQCYQTGLKLDKNWREMLKLKMRHFLEFFNHCGDASNQIMTSL